MTDDLGPLPKADRQDTLQQSSIKAFRNLLPEEHFLFREQRVDDKGVDGMLEVKQNSTFTNCLAQVQLKSTDDGPDAYNADGSYSLSIKTSNLNYLLNGPSPIYVLWFATTGELRFAWVREEWRRLAEENCDWMKHSSFTVRFRDVLTAAALEKIHDRILKEARMSRHIHDTVARSAPAERVMVGIEAETLDSTDPNELRQRLLDNGMTLVSSGYGKQVLESFSLLNLGATNEPRIQLVAGFAEFSLGRHHAALGHLAQAAIGRDQLSADDGMFMERLRTACDFQTGRLGWDDYARKEQEWANRLTGIQAAEHHLEMLRHTRLRERDLDCRTALLQQMRVAVDGILAAPTAVPAQKIQARLALLAAESDDIISQMVETAGQINIRQEAGLLTAGIADEVMQDLEVRWANWQRESRQVLDDAVESQHPLLIADAIAGRVTTFVSVFGTWRLNAILRRREEMPAQKPIDELIREAEQALQVYRTAGSVEGEVRIQLLIADLHELVGDNEEAKAKAEEVLPIAEAMDYRHLRDRAKDHVEGTTKLRKWAVRVAEGKPQDQDVYLAEETDDSIQSMAKTLLASFRAPPDRIEMAEKECFVMRQIARERVNWCRYLDLISDERSFADPSTAFREEPERFCQCREHRHKSSEERRDANAAIIDFKLTFCSACQDRRPLGADSESP